MGAVPSMYERVQKQLQKKPAVWAITGVAGFIGSNLLERLLALDQKVIGLDNFSTGHKKNLEEVRALVRPEQWSRFRFLKGDVRRLEDCRKVCNGVDYILHEAALGSVPRSLEDPILTHENNITGTLNMLVAARDCQVRRFVYAASSSTYGDHPGLPKREEKTGRPLSPYAVTKYTDELYAGVFTRCYGLETVGLRYFNVFGRRQDPRGVYAAVIPKWILALLGRKEPIIFGDGKTSRDFCYIDHVVQANILAATTKNKKAVNQIYNVAAGDRTTLRELFHIIRELLSRYDPEIGFVPSGKGPFRAGDVRHSQADISKAKRLLGYRPSHTVKAGMKETVDWFIGQRAAS